MERVVEDSGHFVTLSPNYRHHHPVEGGDQQCGLQLELRDVLPCHQELRCERSALTVPLLRQDPPPAYAKTSPSSPASSTLTTSTLLSPSLLPPYPRPSSPPPPYSPPPQPPSRRLLVVLTVVIMLLSSLTVGITWKHWELMASIQSQGKKVDHAPASTPPRYILGPESYLPIFDTFLYNSQHFSIASKQTQRYKHKHCAFLNISLSHTIQYQQTCSIYPAENLAKYGFFESFQCSGSDRK